MYFKKIAESHGLLCIKDDKIGYSLTEYKPETLLLPIFKDIDKSCFNYYRINVDQHSNNGNNKVGNSPTSGTTSKKGNSHSIKHTCPQCGNSARTTKPFNLICGNCHVLMDMEF
jgi:hypothetical protein